MGRLERDSKEIDGRPTSILDSDEIQWAIDSKEPYTLKEGTVVDLELHRQDKSSLYEKKNVRGVILNAPVNVNVASLSEPSRGSDMRVRSKKEQREPANAEFSLDSPKKRQVEKYISSKEEITPENMDLLREVDRNLTQDFLQDKGSLLRAAGVRPGDVESVRLRARVSPHRFPKKEN